MARRIIGRRELTPSAYGLAPVDPEQVLVEKATAWEAVDPGVARRLVEQAGAVSSPARQVIVELLALLAGGHAVQEVCAVLARQLPSGLPWLLLSLRPQVNRELCDLLRSLTAADAIPAYFSLLEHPASLTAESIDRATSLVAELCRIRDRESAADESRFLALLDSTSPLVRKAVAETIASVIAWTLVVPNPAYDAESTEHELQRYEDWFGALVRRARDSAIVPALCRAACENRDRRALPVLQEIADTGSDEARAAAVAALVEIGGAAHAERPLRHGTDAVRRSALHALPTVRLRILLLDPAQPLALREYALGILSERRDITGRWEFGQPALEKLARNTSQPLELRRAAFARLLDDRVPYGDPLRTELA